MMRRASLGLLLLLGLAQLASAQLAIRFQFALIGFGPGQPFREPLAVAFEPWSGTAYVADTGNNRVLAFSSQGIPLHQFSVAGPVAVAATRERIFISDSRKVVALTARGEAETSIDLAQAGAEGSLRPDRLATDEDGNLYVGDTQGAQVLKFDARGTFQFRFGRPGDGPGAFKVIAGIAVDRTGRIYVSDSLGLPVQIFDRAGRYLATIGIRGAAPDEFAFPAGIAVDRSGRVWVADQNRHNVKSFDAAGRLLGTVGSYGLREGSFFFPVAVATDDFARLFVLEKGANRLQVFQLDRP